jgi:hypothetical protein
MLDDFKEDFAMDEPSFYKAKEELVGFCKSYIDERFDTEKSLIKDYLGFAGKVAVAGIGIAVLTVGFFGVKTYDDVNKSIQAEIKARFDKENPVAKYEVLLKEAAIDGVVAALIARIERDDRLFGAEESLSFLTRALQDDSVSAERKSQILDFAARLPSPGNRQSLGRAARKLIDFDFKDNRESGVRVMNSLLRLYGSVDTNLNVTDALNILEKYKDEGEIVKGVSSLLDGADAASGNRIVPKLANYQGAVTRFRVAMFDLRTNPNAKLDEVWLTSLVKKMVEGSSTLSVRDSDDTLDSAAFVAAVNDLKAEDGNFWAVCAAFAKEAKQKKLTIVYYRRDEERSRPVIGLRLGSFTRILDPAEYSKLYQKLARAFVVRSEGFANPSPDDLAVLEFWSARQTVGGRLSRAPGSAEALVTYRPYFLYSSAGEVRDESGAIVASERQNGALAIKLEQLRSETRFRVHWRDAMGKLNDLTAAQLKGIDKAGIKARTGVVDFDSDVENEL